MKIRMYECGFGDCFRLMEKNQVDLYVDFGIHTSSWSGVNRANRFDGIIADMGEEKDFLLTHYHDDHFNGAIYMAAHTHHRFRNVYISDVWDMPGSVDITMLLLLRGIFTRSVILGKNTIIDFLQSICTRESRIHFISRGMSFQNDRFIALWPEKNYVAKQAQKMLRKLRTNLNGAHLGRIEKIANKLNLLVVNLGSRGSDDGSVAEYVIELNELRDEYLDAQMAFDDLYGDEYDNNIQYKLTEFGNNISIVFQNYKADRNVLFTGDFGKKRNWSFIENNKDGVADMHAYYDVIKLPHHGTCPYYHSFVRRVQATSTFMIPNGYVAHPWYVDSRYGTDSLAVKNRTVCAHDTACSQLVCHRCNRIYPGLYFDI